MDSFSLALLAAAAFLIAGSVKGLVGLGLPTTAIGLLTLAIEPRAAIALVLFPMIFSNAWQVWRMGQIAATVRRYAWFAVVLAVSVGLTTILAGAISDRLLMGIMGGSILIFVLVDLALSLPAIPDRMDRAAQVIFGLLSGLMGGLTAVWAPPMMIYLAARHTDRDEFVRASGFLVLVGSLPLTIGYVRLGLLTGPLALISLAMVVPTVAGFALGEAGRNRLPADRFRRVLLGVFCLFGLNLLRRAFLDG